MIFLSVLSMDKEVRFFFVIRVVIIKLKEKYSFIFLHSISMEVIFWGEMERNYNIQNSQTML